MTQEFPKAHDQDTGDVIKTAAAGIAHRQVRDPGARSVAAREVPPDLPPGAPLVEVETAADLGQGDLIRVRHAILGTWATGWLEVVAIVGDRIVLDDASTGEEDIRYVSDTVPCWKWPG